MGLFNKKQTKKAEVAEKPQRSEALEHLKREHELEIREIKKNHELELKQKDFEMKHLKDDTVLYLQKKLQLAEIKIATLEKENKMLDRIVDLNGDIIDVKNLVSKLIDKLPTIDLQSLTVNNNGSSK